MVGLRVTFTLRAWQTAQDFGTPGMVTGLWQVAEYLAAVSLVEPPVEGLLSRIKTSKEDWNCPHDSVTAKGRG